VTFVDSTVAMDALNPASPFHQWSLGRLGDHAAHAFFNHIVVAELAGRAESEIALQRMIDLLAIRIDPLDEGICFRAGQAFRAWVRNGGRRGAMLPDLLIGAHAAVRKAAVLTRDPRRFRAYFPEVELITPDAGDE
jgi:predicted nucleic acid-binding protein